jgi:hypothetical protein
MRLAKGEIISMKIDVISSQNATESGCNFAIDSHKPLSATEDEPVPVIRIL